MRETRLGEMLALEIDHTDGRVLICFSGRASGNLRVSLSPTQSKSFARALRRYARYAEIIPVIGPASVRRAARTALAAK